MEGRLHPDEPHSAGLVYLEDAERGREVFEREARRQHTEAEWKALPPWKRQHIVEWRKARGKGRKGRELEESMDVEKNVRSLKEMDMMKKDRLVEQATPVDLQRDQAEEERLPSELIVWSEIKVTCWCIAVTLVTLADFVLTKIIIQS